MFYQQQGSLVVNDKQFPLRNRGWLEDEKGDHIGISPYRLDKICCVMHVRR